MLGLLAQASPAQDSLWQLGGYVVAMVLGAGGVYKFGVLPTRKDKDDERSERISSQAQTIDTLRSVLPALQGSQEVVAQVLAILPSLEALVGPRSAPKR